jgi:hypothetical protein
MKRGWRSGLVSCPKNEGEPRTIVARGLSMIRRTGSDAGGLRERGARRIVGLHVIVQDALELLGDVVAAQGDGVLAVNVMGPNKTAV